MAGASKDKFANKFFGYSLESAANTLTFREIQTNVDMMSKRAWVLHKLEWFFSPVDLDKLIAGQDRISAALVSSDKLTALDLNSPGVIDLIDFGILFASAVGQSFYTQPFTRDLTGLPGGGLIVAPRPLYVAVKGTSLGSAVTANVRGYYTNLDMSADEYLELVDFYRIVQ